MPPMNPAQLKLLVPVVILLILGAILYQVLGPNAAAPTKARTAPTQLQAMLVEPPQAVADFVLKDQAGADFTQAQFQGHWTLMFFGYTYCPDICPTTLAALAAMKQALSDSPQLLAKTRFVMVSLDPKRDTPQKLGPYIRYFDPDFSAITGERTMLDSLSASLNIPYALEGDVNSDNYLVNHSATIVLIGPEGRLRARFNPPHFGAHMAERYRELVRFLN